MRVSIDSVQHCEILTCQSHFQFDVENWSAPQQRWIINNLYNSIPTYQSNANKNNRLSSRRPWIETFELSDLPNRFRSPWFHLTKSETRTYFVALPLLRMARERKDSGTYSKHSMHRVAFKSCETERQTVMLPNRSECAMRCYYDLSVTAPRCVRASLMNDNDKLGGAGREVMATAFFDIELWLRLDYKLLLLRNLVWHTVCIVYTYTSLMYLLIQRIPCIHFLIIHYKNRVYCIETSWLPVLRVNSFVDSASQYNLVLVWACKSIVGKCFRPAIPLSM